jgi:hypothetical protein
MVISTIRISEGEGFSSGTVEIHKELADTADLAGVFAQAISKISTPAAENSGGEGASSIDVHASHIVGLHTVSTVLHR